jgi:hypothetical protein
MFENLQWPTGAPSSGMETWRAGYAVRRDWPDGVHEFVGFRATRLEADRFVDGDRGYWRRGPVRPLAWTVVVISRRDFDLHAGRHECRSPDCPTWDGVGRAA